MKLKTKAEQLKLNLRNFKINFISSISERTIPVPIYLFCHHKTGTILLRKIFKDICQLKGWKFLALPGMVNQVPKSYDIILFEHSLINGKLLETPFIGVHLIRDPRDIIVSGYQYHLRTKEKWCTNKDFRLDSPIKYPQVPFCMQHHSEKCKIEYLKSLNNKSYQENLLTLSQNDGLMFEMNKYGSWTIQEMMSWKYNNSSILEIKFEDLMNNFDSTFKKMMIFCNLLKQEDDIDKIFQIAKQHDLNSKSEKEIASIKHVTSKETSRWKQHFDKNHRENFLDKFGDVLIKLGYEKDNSWGFKN